MRFLGRWARGEKPQEGTSERHESVRPGAWYPERTEVVRGAANGEAAQAQPPNAGIADSGYASAGRDQAEEKRTQQDRSTDFPVSMEAAVGEKLRVFPTDPKLSAQAWRKLGLSWAQWMAMGRSASVVHHGYDVLAPGGRAGSLSLGGRAELARMACAEGAWCLKKRRRLGWELIIESADGRHVGWYSGRRWLPGGTIYLTDGTQVDLRRLLNGRWKLQTTGARQRLVDIRTSHRPLMTLTIRSLAATITEVHLVILTACGVLMLERMTPRVSELGGGGLG